MASEIPPLMEARYPVLRIENVRGGVKVPAAAAKAGGGISVSGDGSFSVVFDRVLSAYPTLRLKGGKGAHVSIHATRQSAMILGGGEQYYESPFMDEIAPAYTVRFSGVSEPIVVENVGANFTSQPVDYLGSFTCSDEKLNKIWKASRWAVQICMQTHHLDSPNHQEPICDPGDYVIEAAVSYHAFGQPWLARQDIRKFAWLLKNEKYRNFHTSYSLYWLQMLMDYYRFTGDEKLVKEMAPYVHELMDTYAQWLGKNDLVSEAPNYMFMDWVKIGGFECHHPPAVIGQGYLSALYCHALRQAIEVTEMNDYGKGDREPDPRERKYEALGYRIQAAFDRELWDDSKGLYRDGRPFQTSVKPGQWLPADKPIETFSPHVNLLAANSFYGSREHFRAIVEKVLSAERLNTQPWFMHWVFQAMDREGLFDKYAVAQLRRWEVVPQTQSFREMWDGGDLSHGWCSTPLVQMSSRMLGASTSSHRRMDCVIRLPICGLRFAKGRVPTPRGFFEVAWTVSDRKLETEFTVPTGMKGIFPIPDRFTATSISFNGHPVADVRSDVPQAFEVPPGHYKFIVNGKLKSP